MPVTGFRAGFTFIGAGRLPFEIAGAQINDAVIQKLVAGVFVVIADRTRLHISHALAEMQIAGLMAIILRLDTLVRTHPPTGRRRQGIGNIFDRLGATAKGQKRDENQKEGETHAPVYHQCHT